MSTRAPNVQKDSDQSDKDHLTFMQDSFQSMLDNNMSFFKEIMSLQKDLQQHLPISAPDILEKLNHSKRGLTIFSPSVIKDTLEKAQKTLHKQLKENPEHLKEIGVKHFTKQQDLNLQTMQKMLGGRSEVIAQAKNGDKRFAHPIWDHVPYYSHLKQSYLLFAELAESLTYQLKDMDDRTHAKLTFYTQQLVDLLSPSNFAFLNPEVIKETFETKGENLKRGMLHFLEDLEHGYVRMTDTKAFEVGKNIASTEGEVIFRNELLELIRYTPTTKTVYSIPLLIVPAWINKFYVFDLRPENSFVKWCLSQGIQVYIVSWINPTKDTSRKSFGDYVLQGVYDATRHVLEDAKVDQLNIYGFCAGGILVNCLMAYLESHKIKSPFKSASTIASPIDTSKGGNILAYICDSQLEMLENSLDELGFIPAAGLINSFSLLKPKELMWSFYVNHYLLGKDVQPFDMLYWNCDAVNLPGRMHLKYLKAIFNENKLMQRGALRVAGTPIDLSLIKTPAFIFGAMKDHIVPWESIYPLTQIIGSDKKTFVLGGSGHVAGVINPPHANKYEFWSGTTLPESAQKWIGQSHTTQGSWWNYWLNWLQPYLGEKVKTPSREKGIEKAPGSYVLRKG